MDYTKFHEFLISNGKVLRDHNGRQVTKEKFSYMCLTRGISLQNENIDDIYDKAIGFLKPQETDVFTDAAQAIANQSPFKNFKARGTGRSDSLIYYKINENEVLCLGSAMDLDARELASHISSKKILQHILEYWRELLSPYATQLKINLRNADEVVTWIWSTLFTGPLEMEYEEIDFSQPPAILEGFGRGTEYTIPFKKKQASLDDLNPVLKDFLERMEDHKYFCAILAGRFIGKQKHYIPWLYGKGGEGKSTFTAFLNKIIPNGSVELNLNDKTTGLWEALGKTFLIIPDTNNKNIFHYEEVKKISGQDSVVVNGKYKHARTEKLPGMIIITSNKLPNIGSFEYAKRRARIFKISTNKLAGTKFELDVVDATKEMSKTSNEFLNYCLQCLEEVGNIQTGQVPEPPSSITHNTKSLEEYEYLDFIEDNKLSLGSDLTIKGKDLRKLLTQDQKNRSDFFKDNFLEYIQNYCHVTFDDGEYQGIGRLSSRKEKILDNEILEALPKD